MSWYSTRPLHQHTQQQSGHTGDTRAVCNDAPPLAQTDSPGLGVDEAVDEFHIVRVHGVIMVLHKEIWKLQSEHRK